MKIKESNFVEELSHRNEKALEYVMVHYGGLVKSVVTFSSLYGNISTHMTPPVIHLQTGLAELPD